MEFGPVGYLLESEAKRTNFFLYCTQEMLCILFS